MNFFRLILEMTVEQSRVRDTRGKILLVLSEPVRSLGKKLTEFIDQMKENLRGNEIFPFNTSTVRKI